jgi:hypothetical protein
MPSDGGRLQAYVVRYPAVAYTASSAALALFALSPTPSLAPVALLVAILRLSAWTFVPRPRGYLKGALQASLVSLSAGLAHLAPGLTALSTPTVAFVVISAISLLTSGVAVFLVFLGCVLGRSSGTPWTRLTVFPALWASGWGCMASVSPVGQLVTWSPVLGLGLYA